MARTSINQSSYRNGRTRKSGKRHHNPKKEMPWIFTDEWIDKVNSNLREMAAIGIDSPDHTFSESARTSYAHFCLAYMALDALDTDQLIKVLTRAEEVCNKFGFSFLPEEFTIDRCPTRNHSKCTGKFVHRSLAKQILCKCPCHKTVRP